MDLEGKKSEKVKLFSAGGKLTLFSNYMAQQYVFGPEVKVSVEITFLIYHIYLDEGLELELLIDLGLKSENEL